MCCAVCFDLDPLALDAVAVRHPDALAVAVARMRIAGVWIRLLRGAVTIEHVQGIGKRRVSILGELCADDWIEVAGLGRQRAASLKPKNQEHDSENLRCCIHNCSNARCQLL